MTTRREALAAIASALITWPRAGNAQASRRVPRIGVLAGVDFGEDRDTLTSALRDLGYVDSASVALEWRAGNGTRERLLELAADLVRRKVDVLVTLGSAPTLIAKQATSAIPIVFSVGDPVGAGFVPSLARPGSNLTGISSQSSDFAPKCLQLLKDVRPELSVLTVLFSPGNASAAPFLREAEKAAPALKLSIQRAAVTSVADLDSILAAVERAPPRAMVVLDQDDARVGAFALRNRVPTLALRQLSDRGWLMSYGISGAQISRQLAHYVDKIIRGARPADLPVRQPTKLELVINLRTAKAIGITIPQSLLLRADEVIQ